MPIVNQNDIDEIFTTDGVFLKIHSLYDPQIMEFLPNIETQLLNELNDTN